MSSSSFRYDWLGSLERIAAAGEEPAAVCFYCLPIAGVKLLVALLERARWRASYTGFGYELTPEEWTLLTDIVDDTEVALSSHCDDLIASIVNQVTTQITNQTILMNSLNDLCCATDSEGNPAPVFPPDPSEEPGGFGTEAGDRCARSQAAHDGTAEFMEGVFNLTESLGGLTAGALWIWITTAILTAPISLPIALVGIIVAAIVTIVGDSLTEDALSNWEDLRHEIACCFAWNETAGQAKTCIHDAIDAADIPSSHKSLFKAIMHQGRVNAIWNGEDGYVGTGYSSTFCNDCISGDPIALKFRIDQYQTEASGGANNGMGWVSEAGFSDDWIATTGRVNKEDIDGFEPVTVILRDSSSPDVTNYPGYSAAWQVFNHWNKDATEKTAFLGMQNASGSPKIASASISGFEVLKYDGTAYTWLPAPIVVTGTLPTGLTAAGGSMDWAEQEWPEYPADYELQGVRVEFDYEP